MASFLVVTSNLEPKAYKIAHQLRSMNKNIRLDLQLSKASLKAKLRRATKSDADYAIIVGDEELKTNTVIFKYLKDESNDQETLSVDELFNIYKSI